MVHNGKPTRKKQNIVQSNINTCFMQILFKPVCLLIHVFVIMSTNYSKRFIDEVFPPEMMSDHFPTTHFFFFFFFFYCFEWNIFPKNSKHYYLFNSITFRSIDLDIFVCSLKNSIWGCFLLKCVSERKTFFLL
jgi:hypothetical protein